MFIPSLISGAVFHRLITTSKISVNRLWKYELIKPTRQYILELKMKIKQAETLR